MPGSSLDLSKASRCILVAEDDADDVFLLLRALRKLAPHVKVLTASDGQEAIDRLKEETTAPNLILTDLKMAGLDGFELLSWVKSDPTLGTIPTVVFCSSNQEPDMEHARSLGANGYQVKPTNYDEYMAVITNLCKEYLAA
jgi:CheY-like chemotaxis protein